MSQNPSSSSQEKLIELAKKIKLAKAQANQVNKGSTNISVPANSPQLISPSNRIAAIMGIGAVMSALVALSLPKWFGYYFGDTKDQARQQMEEHLKRSKKS